MKTGFPTVAVLTFILVVTLPAAAAPPVALVQAVPYPGRDPAMWDGLYAARDGRVYSGLITEGESAHFYVYEPTTGRNRLLFDMAEVLNERGKGIRTSGKLHNKPVEDRHGQLYFVPLNNGSGPRNFNFNTWRGGRWLRYRPQDGKLDDLGPVDDGVGIYPLAIDQARDLLYGIGFTGYLYRFDIQKRVTTNLGRVSNWDVCRRILCDDRGNVYGSFPVARIWKFDAKTQQLRDLSVRTPYDPEIFPTQLGNPMIDRSCDWRAIEWDDEEKAAYGVTCGSGSILFRFAPHDGPDGSVTALGRLCDSRFLEPGRKDIPYSTLAFALDPRRKQVYFAPSARGYELGHYAETFGSDAPHHLIRYDLPRKMRIDAGPMRTADGRRVFGCEGASVAPDGTLYLCGQVEVLDPAAATGRVGKIPVVLHLIVYRPKS